MTVTVIVRCVNSTLAIWRNPSTRFGGIAIVTWASSQSQGIRIVRNCLYLETAITNLVLWSRYFLRKIGWHRICKGRLLLRHPCAFNAHLHAVNKLFEPYICEAILKNENTTWAYAGKHRTRLNTPVHVELNPHLLVSATSLTLSILNSKKSFAKQKLCETCNAVCFSWL